MFKKIKKRSFSSQNNLHDKTNTGKKTEVEINEQQARTKIGIKQPKLRYVFFEEKVEEKFNNLNLTLVLH